MLTGTARWVNAGRGGVLQRGGKVGGCVLEDVYTWRLWTGEQVGMEFQSGGWEGHTGVYK